MRKTKTWIKKVHFIALAIAVLHTLIRANLGYGLISEVELALELTIPITGFLLFFLYYRPWEKISYYFLLYPVLAILFGLGMVFKNLLFALIVGGVLAPIVPNDIDFEQEQYRIVTPYQGFMGRCCVYQLKEKELGIFVKDYPVFQVEGQLDFSKLQIEAHETYLEVSYPHNFEPDSLVSLRFAK